MKLHRGPAHPGSTEEVIATAALIALDQYLNTSCRPDREYIDGKVLERNNMGKWEHARIQALPAS